MRFTVLIPARLASTRLPGKPLADIAGLPMIVHVAQRATRSSATRVVVAADAQAIVDACQLHGVEALLTDPAHATGSDRLAQACDVLGLEDGELVVNVQGDEPLIDPALIDACARLLDERPTLSMSTVAHAIERVEDFHDTNVVKVVVDAHGLALYFSRASIPHWRDAPTRTSLPAPVALRHVGLYGYRAGFLRRFVQLPPSPLEALEALEQLRALWHGERIAVHCCATAPALGVDTPQDLERVRAMVARAQGKGTQ